jgi:hypothetical protein
MSGAVFWAPECLHGVDRDKFILYLLVYPFMNFTKTIIALNNMPEVILLLSIQTE